MSQETPDGCKQQSEIQNRYRKISDVNPQLEENYQIPRQELYRRNPQTHH